MSIAPLSEMTLGEIHEYVEKLETENRDLRKKTDNTKKFTKPEVTRMRALYDGGNWTQRELAEAFDANPATVSRIVRRVYHSG